MRTENEKPHVLHPIEGLRNVDYVAVTEQSFFDFLIAQKYTGHGTEALVVQTQDNANVIRIPFYNFLGKEKISQILTFFLPNVKFERSNYLNTLERLQRLKQDVYVDESELAQKLLVQHVAAANSRFRHNPGSTIPVNTIYTLNDQPIATLEKYIEGRKAYFESQIVNFEKEMMVNGGDFAVGNIFFDVSPYIGEDGTTHYLHPFHLIDFNSFVPSNH